MLLGLGKKQELDIYQTKIFFKTVSFRLAAHQTRLKRFHWVDQTARPTESSKSLINSKKIYSAGSVFYLVLLVTRGKEVIFQHYL